MSMHDGTTILKMNLCGCMQWKAYVNVGTKNRHGGNRLVIFLTKSYKVQNRRNRGIGTRKRVLRYNSGKGKLGW